MESALLHGILPFAYILRHEYHCSSPKVWIDLQSNMYVCVYAPSHVQLFQPHGLYTARLLCLI